MMTLRKLIGSLRHSDVLYNVIFHGIERTGRGQKTSAAMNDSQNEISTAGS
jgi:hypothetical protein